MRISGSGERRVLTCQRMELGEEDESGRRRPIPVPDSEFGIHCDRVILALGQAADLSLLPEDAELAKDKEMHSQGKAPGGPAGFEIGRIVSGAGAAVHTQGFHA